MRTSGVALLFVFVPLVLAADQPTTPPEGKEFAPKNKQYTIVMPTGTRSTQRTQILNLGTHRVPIESALTSLSDGTNFDAASLGIPAVLMRQIPKEERLVVFRDAIVKQLKGKVLEERDLKQGTREGKECVIEGGQGMARMQMYLNGGWVMYAVVDGKTKEIVASKEAEAFFGSFKILEGTAGALRPNTPKDQPADETPIWGGGNNPKVTDKGPADGLLVGFEVGLGKFFNNDVVRAVRPVYRTAKGDTLGERFGMEQERVVRVKAKEGYAVGAIVGKAGLTLDGFSVTFMRIKGDKLDPSDSYESEWLGGKGGGRETLLSGDGRQAIGIVGKVEREKECHGLGLLFRPAAK